MQTRECGQQVWYLFERLFTLATPNPSNIVVEEMSHLNSNSLLKKLPFLPEVGLLYIL